MDKQLIRTRFAKSVRSYAEYAQAQTVIASKLCGLLSSVLTEDPADVLEIGCGTGTFTRNYLRHFRPQRMTLNDICTEMKEMLTDLLETGHETGDNLSSGSSHTADRSANASAMPDIPGETQIRFVPGDAELCDLPDGQDLIVSSSVIQWFEEPGAFIARCHRLLHDEGCLALTTFGPDNFQEITSITGTGLSYLPLEWLCGLLYENGFRILLAEEEHISLNFPSPSDVLRHLKKTGVTGIARTAWTRGRLAAFSSRYSSVYGDKDGNVPLTYHPVYLIARKR